MLMSLVCCRTNWEPWLIWKEYGFQGSSPSYLRRVLLQTWLSLCNHFMLIQLVCLYILQLRFPYNFYLYNFLSFLCTQQYKLTMINSFPGYMISTGSLSHRLGGLYCLYCLYEVQPCKPPFKVYLSIGMLSTFPHSMVFSSFSILMNIVLLIIIQNFGWAVVLNLEWLCQHSSTIIHVLAVDIFMFYFWKK